MTQLTEPAADYGIANSSPVLLAVRNLRISLACGQETGRELVRGVSLRIDRGSIVCLVGESGSGKSLTGYSIMNLLPSENMRITGGEVLFNGTDLLKTDAESLRRIRGSECFLIPQEPLTALNPVLTVHEQLAELFFYHTTAKKREIDERCEELLSLVQMDNVKSRLRAYPHQLSGGQRQRVLIAMAMALNPSLIIADEPTTALDVSVQWEILELFLALKKQRTAGFLFITHDFGVVKAIADRIYVMYNGRILEEGTRDDVLDSPLHPYTQGLIRSVPSIDSTPKTTLPTLGGYTMQSAFNCPFYERCESADESCKEDFVFRYVTETHGVLCRKT